MNKNDKKILELKDKIDKKKGELKKQNKLKEPRLTNLRISTFQHIPINISVMSENHLNITKYLLKSLLNEANVDLFTEDGYLYSDILIDVENILNEKIYNSEMFNLKLAEKQLKKLLSDRVQKELEIENIIEGLNI